MRTAHYSVGVSCAIVLLIWAWRVLNWVWLRPKKLEKCLRQQGFSGNSYKLFFGDIKEMSMMIEEAKSKPINLSNDIVLRVIPFVHKTIKKYGENSFIWLGPRPVVHIMDPENIRDILSKNYQFQRPKGNPLTKFIATGLLDSDTEKWAKHRKIINPAFHLEKLKAFIHRLFHCHHSTAPFHHRSGQYHYKSSSLCHYKSSSPHDLHPHRSRMGLPLQNKLRQPLMCIAQPLGVGRLLIFA